MSDRSLTYLSMDSVAEGIGFSQVLAYVEKLAQRGLDVDLHTFEKKAPDHSLERRLAAAGARWHVHAFGRFGPVGGVERVVRGAVAIRGAGLVHARSDLAAASALLARSRTWVWDFRSFYVDQKIELGELKKGSLQEKVLRRIERGSARRSSAIITLTEASLPKLAEVFGPSAADKAHVITTCVDLSRFTVTPMPATADLRFLLAGTINSYYDVPRMIDLVDASRARRPSKLIVVSPGSTTWSKMLDTAADGSLQGSPDEMPAITSNCHVGLCVCRDDVGISLAGSMPTKIGEFLACGRPIIVNERLGDAGELVREHRCGVVLRDGSRAAMDECLEELDELVSDSTTSDRCRSVAEEHFNLDAACDRLIDIYGSLG